MAASVQVRSSKELSRRQGIYIGFIGGRAFQALLVFQAPGFDSLLLRVGSGFQPLEQLVFCGLNLIDGEPQGAEGLATCAPYSMAIVLHSLNTIIKIGA